MKLEGRATVALPLADAWQRINDPRVLESCAPGLERLEPTGPDSYDAVVELKLPAVQGRFTGTLEFLERRPPELARLRVQGKGGPGFVDGNVELHLAETDEGTELRYTADVHVGGQVGRLGQRMVSGMTRELAGQFFESLERWESADAGRAVREARPGLLRLLWRGLLRFLGLRRG